MILTTAPRFLFFWGIIFSGDYALWLHPRLYSSHAYGVSVCMLRESRNKKIGELLHDAEGMAGQNRLPMQAYPAGIYFVRLESQVVGVVKR